MTITNNSDSAIVVTYGSKPDSMRFETGETYTIWAPPSSAEYFVQIAVAKNAFNQVDIAFIKGFGSVTPTINRTSNTGTVTGEVTISSDTSNNTVSFWSRNDAGRISCYTEVFFNEGFGSGRIRFGTLG